MVHSNFLSFDCTPGCGEFFFFIIIIFLGKISCFQSLYLPLSSFLLLHNAPLKWLINVSGQFLSISQWAFDQYHESGWIKTPREHLHAAKGTHCIALKCQYWYFFLKLSEYLGHVAKYNIIFYLIMVACTQAFRVEAQFLMGKRRG